MNKERRDYATKLAKKVARLLKSSKAPVCDRVSRRRGYAEIGGSRFSVPQWIFSCHPVYRDYYITHEACHCITGGQDGESRFHAAEQSVMEKFAALKDK